MVGEMSQLKGAGSIPPDIWKLQWVYTTILSAHLTLVENKGGGVYRNSMSGAS